MTFIPSLFFAALFLSAFALSIAVLFTCAAGLVGIFAFERLIKHAN